MTAPACHIAPPGTLASGPWPARSANTRSATGTVRQGAVRAMAERFRWTGAAPALVAPTPKSSATVRWWRCGGGRGARRRSQRRSRRSGPRRRSATSRSHHRCPRCPTLASFVLMGLPFASVSWSTAPLERFVDFVESLASGVVAGPAAGAVDVVVGAGADDGTATASEPDAGATPPSPTGAELPTGAGRGRGRGLGRRRRGRRQRRQRYERRVRSPFRTSSPRRRRRAPGRPRHRPRSR